jgi:hypothetical protein
MCGIELDSITGGALVDNTMETSIAGIYAGGNVLHVNDLVDNVTKEAEIAGAGAASFVMGKAKLKKHRVRLGTGKNIMYIIPQTVTRGEEVILSMRVKEPAEKVQLKLGQILTKNLRVVKPSEMVQITISSKEWQKMDGETDELEISCESRRSS